MHACRDTVAPSFGAEHSISLSLWRIADPLPWWNISIDCGRCTGGYGAKHPFQTLAICILPDHLHAIWRLPEGDTDYPPRWSLINSGFSRNLKPSEARSSSKLSRREKGIWQRRYWEHQIRDDPDMERHVDYIHANPLKHGLVSKLVDWPYSSFHRYVADGLLANNWAGGVLDECEFGE